MKPADLYLHGSHIFGFVLPGVVLVSGGLLLAGKNPVSVIESGNVPLRLFVLAFVGYLAWTPLFALIYLLLQVVRRPAFETPANLGAARAAIGVPKDWTDQRVIDACKWYVHHHSAPLTELLDAMEIHLNLVAAFPVPFTVFVFGLVRYRYGGFGAVPIWLDGALGVLGLAVIIAAWRTFRVSYREERRLFCDMVVVLSKETL